MSFALSAALIAALGTGTGYALGIAHTRRNSARSQDESITALVAHETRIAQVEKQHAQFDGIARQLRKDFLRWQDESVRDFAGFKQCLTQQSEATQAQANHITSLQADFDALKADNLGYQGCIDSSLRAITADAVMLTERMDAAFNRIDAQRRDLGEIKVQAAQYNSYWSTQLTKAQQGLSERLDELERQTPKVVDAIKASGDMLDALDGRLVEMQQFIVSAAEEARSRIASKPTAPGLAAQVPQAQAPVSVAPVPVAPVPGAPVPGAPVPVAPVPGAPVPEAPDLGQLLRRQQELQRLFNARRDAGSAQPLFPQGL